MPPIITAFRNAPDGDRALMRDMRIRWALEEVGQRYEVRLLSYMEMKRPAHRALNPFGQIPTYEEDGLVLFESGAIVLHIAERYRGLLPTDTAARARAIGWMFAALNTVEPAISGRMIDDIRLKMSELSAYLGTSEWLDGTFSAGDLLMVMVLRTLVGSGLLEAHQNLVAYVQRAEARPAFLRARSARQTA